MSSMLPRLLLGALVVLPACAATTTATPLAAGVRSVPLPGPDGHPGLIDYLGFDPATGLVWVPAGDRGAVFVIDSASGSVRRIDGFPVGSLDRRGRRRTVGPSAAAVGDGVVYIGNPADSTVCAIDARRLTRGPCGQLQTGLDAVVWVAPTREVWVTTPDLHAIQILDGATLAPRQQVPLPGMPEGWAVDGRRGAFYTNLLEDDRTVAIDLKTHEVRSAWRLGCGRDGPRGLALDEAGGWLFVACPGRLDVRDVANDGVLRSSLETGEGVDNPEYDPLRHRVFAAAAGAARLTIARVDDRGVLSLERTVATRPGARNPVIDGTGAAWIAHDRGSALLVVSPAP